MEENDHTPEEHHTEETYQGQPAAAGAGYRVALGTYSGPLDLLLYLIRKEEVDISDIPIARITEQYLRHIQVLAEINVNLAGEFLVLASTLMEIKSRMLLPREEGLEEEEEDPRAELVRQLLEYKRYKDIARELGSRATQQSLKFPHSALDSQPGGPLTPGEEEGEGVAGLEGIGLWELIDAFAKVLSETTLGPAQPQVVERQRSLHEFRRQLLRTVARQGEVAFSRIFAECNNRDEMIAMFVALLELVRLRRVRLHQPAEFGELYLRLVEGGEQPQPPKAQPGEHITQAGPARPVPRLKSVDVVRGLEEEQEALGRARKKIDAAIESTESFLSKHHQQARREQSAPPSQGHAAGSQSEAKESENLGRRPEDA